MEYKLCIGDPKSGKTFKKGVAGAEAKVFFGKKIGDRIEGSKIGLEGYEFEIRGGSDYCGFPMRFDVMGGTRKRVLITKGVGNRDNWEGRRKRRTVVGKMVSEKIVQINLKVLKHGKAPLGETKEEAKKEGAKSEVVKEEKAAKEASKAPEKKAAEAPKQEKS